MRTIIKGYSDPHGLSGAQTVADVEVDEVKKYEIMDTARRLHQFPSGVKRLRMFRLEDDAIDDVAYISDEVAQYQAKSQEQREKQAKAERQIAAQSMKANDNLNAARKLLDLAARKRNEAVAAVAAQKNLALAAIPEKDKVAISKKLEELQPKADAAIADFQEVLKQFDVLKNSKSTPEAVEAALVTLGIKKPSQ